VRDDPANLCRSRAGRGCSVAIVVYDGVSAFELGIAGEIFGTDWGPVLGVPWYRADICTLTRGPVRVDVGYEVRAAGGTHTISAADMIVVLPGMTIEQAPGALAIALRRAHARGSRIVSLCTGAFALAEAGLLDGRRATTHWTDCAGLAQRYPRVQVDPGVLFVDEGSVLTSAGSAAGIDLCLHVVRQDYGTEIATQLARQLVVQPQRDGGQAQYIEAPMPATSADGHFANTLDWLREHLDEPVTVQDLAARAAMSPRTFARRFLASTGVTPYQWLLTQRVQLAQRLLESSDLSIDAVAEASGFSTAPNLRKHFSRTVRNSPQAYRRAFAAVNGHIPPRPAP
jgi:AraC family transcriptional regulator, transcriptional activator FtrA